MSERPASLTVEDDALLQRLAGKIVGRGLEAPAMLWLESARPISFLGSQAMHFLNPFVQMLTPSTDFSHLAEILEERDHLERLLVHIEEAASAEQPKVTGHPPRTGPSDNDNGPQD